MPSTPAPLEARPGSARHECEEAIAVRLTDGAPFGPTAWSDDDPRWERLQEALLFIDARSSELDDYYAFRAAAASTWRILTNLEPAFNLAGAGTDTLVDSRISAQMASYAIIVRELKCIKRTLGALLEDVAHVVAPIEDDNETVVSEATR